MRRAEISASTLLTSAQESCSAARTPGASGVSRGQSASVGRRELFFASVCGGGGRRVGGSSAASLGQRAGGGGSRAVSRVEGLCTCLLPSLFQQTPLDSDWGAHSSPSPPRAVAVAAQQVTSWALKKCVSGAQRLPTGGGLGGLEVGGEECAVKYARRSPDRAGCRDGASGPSTTGQSDEKTLLEHFLLKGVGVKTFLLATPRLLERLRRGGGLGVSYSEGRSRDFEAAVDFCVGVVEWLSQSPSKAPCVLLLAMRVFFESTTRRFLFHARLGDGCCFLSLASASSSQKRLFKNRAEKAFLTSCCHKVSPDAMCSKTRRSGVSSCADSEEIGAVIESLSTDAFFLSLFLELYANVHGSTLPLDAPLCLFKKMQRLTGSGDSTGLSSPAESAFFQRLAQHLQTEKSAAVSAGEEGNSVAATAAASALALALSSASDWKGSRLGLVLCDSNLDTPSGEGRRLLSQGLLVSGAVLKEFVLGSGTREAQTKDEIWHSGGGGSAGESENHPVTPAPHFLNPLLLRPLPNDAGGPSDCAQNSKGLAVRAFSATEANASKQQAPLPPQDKEASAAALSFGWKMRGPGGWHANGEAARVDASSLRCLKAPTPQTFASLPGAFLFHPFVVPEAPECRGEAAELCVKFMRSLEALLQLVDEERHSPAQTQVTRQVMHFGVVFDYQAKAVVCPPEAIPLSAEEYLRRFNAKHFQLLLREADGTGCCCASDKDAPDKNVSNQQRERTARDEDGSLEGALSEAELHRRFDEVSSGRHPFFCRDLDGTMPPAVAFLLEFLQNRVSQTEVSDEALGRGVPGELSVSAPLRPLESKLRSKFSQVTLNRYALVAKKGCFSSRPVCEGIGAHVDTHFCFDEALCIFSFGGAACMEMQWHPLAAQEKPEMHKAKGGLRRECFPEPGEGAGLAGPRLRLLLPPFSLLVLTGDSRFAFTHRIRSTAWERQIPLCLSETAAALKDDRRLRVKEFIGAVDFLLRRVHTLRAKGAAASDSAVHRRPGGVAECTDGSFLSHVVAESGFVGAAACDEAQRLLLKVRALLTERPSPPEQDLPRLCCEAAWPPQALDDALERSAKHLRLGGFELLSLLLAELPHPASFQRECEAGGEEVCFLAFPRRQRWSLTCRGLRPLRRDAVEQTRRLLLGRGGERAEESPKGPFSARERGEESGLEAESGAALLRRLFEPCDCNWRFVCDAANAEALSTPTHLKG